MGGLDAQQTYAITDIPGVGRVQDWNEVIDVDLPLVTFDGTCVFESDGAVVTSTSTLAFRERETVTADLAATTSPSRTCATRPTVPVANSCSWRASARITSKEQCYPCAG